MSTAESSPKKSLRDRLFVPLIGLCIALFVVSAAWVASHWIFVSHVKNAVIVSQVNDKPRGWVLADAVARLLENELNAPLGWQDNDILCFSDRSTWCLLGDDNRSRQWGVVKVTRQVLEKMRTKLTKPQNAAPEDINLIEAATSIGNDTSKWWMTSYESWLESTVTSLSKYKQGLEAGSSKPLNMRTQDGVVDLVELLYTQVGASYGMLSADPQNPQAGHVDEYGRGVGWTNRDDVFYTAQGMAYAVRVVIDAALIEFGPVLTSVKPGVIDQLKAASVALREAETFLPPVILQGDPHSLFGSLFSHEIVLQNYLGQAKSALSSALHELQGVR